MSMYRRIALVCGRCPNRRILTELVPLRGSLAVPTDTPARPSVSIFELSTGRAIPSRLADGSPATLSPDQVLRCRCRRGHAWSIPVQDLYRAGQAADRASRRDVVAGVDIG